MHRPVILSLLTIVALIAGCQSPPRYHAPAPPDDYELAKTPTNRSVEGRPELGMPMRIPGSDTVIVPFAMESEPRLFERSDRFAVGPNNMTHASVSAYIDSTRVGRSDRGVGTIGPIQHDVRWHNAVMRDLETGEEWVLLDRRAVISRVVIFLEVTGDPSEGLQPKALLFIATLVDSNGDRLINNRDARVAIVTEGDGRIPRVATPEDGQVWETVYDTDDRTLIASVVHDTDGDGEFTAGDEVQPWIWHQDADEPSRPLVSEAAAAALKGLLQEDE